MTARRNDVLQPSDKTSGCPQKAAVLHYSGSFGFEAVIVTTIHDVCIIPLTIVKPINAHASATSSFCILSTLLNNPSASSSVTSINRAGEGQQ